MQPTRQQETAEYDQECELCGDYFDERNMIWLNVWMGSEMRIANNAEGVEVLLCIDCESKVT